MSAKDPPHVVATLLVVAAFAAGCGGSDSARVIDADDVQVLVAAPAEGGDDASVSGTVTVVDGCLGIDDNVAVWPSGTRVLDTDGPVIEVPDLGPVSVGDQVRGAGGYMSAGDLRDDHSPTVPDSCTSADIVVFRPE